MFAVRDNRDFFSIGLAGPTLEIFWSNNYVNFADFFAIDRRGFGEWIYKPKSGDRPEERLDKELSRTGEETYVMDAKTVVSYKILNPNACIRAAVADS